MPAFPPANSIAVVLAIPVFAMAAVEPELGGVLLVLAVALVLVVALRVVLQQAAVLLAPDIRAPKIPIITSNSPDSPKSVCAVKTARAGSEGRVPVQVGAGGQVVQIGGPRRIHNELFGPGADRAAKNSVVGEDGVVFSGRVVAGTRQLQGQGAG